MRRHVLSVSLFVLALSGGAASVAWPQAQELALRGPRFIATWKPSGEAMDVSNAVVLRRRVSLDLTNVTADEALKEITRQADLEISYSKALLPNSRSVSLHAREITVAAALTEVLLDAEVDVAVARGGHMALMKRPVSAPAELPPADSGVVVGRVTDKTTESPIVGAAVVIEGTQHTATTDSDGRYRISDVLAGTYRVRARYIGYAPVETTVTVSAGADAVSDFALTRSIQLLDEVVTTGTILPTEVKALPSPITIITAEDIQAQQLRRIDQVFRTSVPGSFSWETGTNDYTNSINVRGTTNLFSQNTIKTFIDGVEVSSDLYAVIDVNSIERIEILRGPEASTIYGSGASGGVMQVFTKKGELGLRRPRIELKAAGTAVQSPFGSDLRQAYDLAVSGGTENASYHLGGGYQHVGDWAPEYRSGEPSVFVGARLGQDALTLDVSGRYRSKVFGSSAVHPSLRAYEAFQTPEETGQQNQTYSLALGYSATPWWQHRVTVGYDRLAEEYYDTRPRSSDGLFTVFDNSIDKALVRYNSSLSFALSPSLAGTVTTGAEYYQQRTRGFNTSGATLNTGAGIISDPALAPTITRGPTSNSGFFGQTQIAVHDVLFLTAGARAERNSVFGTDFGTAIAPRAGASFVQELGTVTVKVRASYGEGLRPPPFGVAQDGAGFRANPRLGPEEQVGGEVGFDLYFGPHASLGATYYDQTARGLIQAVLVDTAAFIFQPQNVGRIKNRGLEFEGRFNLANLVLQGHYSLTNSTVQDLGPSYFGDLQVGDRLLGIPKHTVGATATYALSPRTSLSAGFVYLGKWTETDWLALYGVFFGGDPYRGSGRDYWITYPSVAKLNVGLQQSFGDNLSGFLQVENLTNNQRLEQSNLALIPGRQTTFGVQFTY